MFFFLSKTLDIFLEPVTWAILFLFASFVLLWRNKSKRWALALFSSGIFVLWLSGQGPFSNDIRRRLEAKSASTYQDNVEYDAVILLGGVFKWGMVEQGQAPVYGQSVERLLSVFELLRKKPNLRVFVSGGVPRLHAGARAEAHILRDKLVEWGIDSSRIDIDAAALNTRENAVNANAWVQRNGYKKVFIVTSAMHMYRAQACFRAVGLHVDNLKVDARAADTRWLVWSLFPRSQYVDETTAVVREWSGYFIYRLKGWA